MTMWKRIVIFFTIHAEAVYRTFYLWQNVYGDIINAIAKLFYRIENAEKWRIIMAVCLNTKAALILYQIS